MQWPIHLEALESRERGAHAVRGGITDDPGRSMVGLLILLAAPCRGGQFAKHRPHSGTPGVNHG